MARDLAVPTYRNEGSCGPGWPLFSELPGCRKRSSLGGADKEPVPRCHFQFDAYKSIVVDTSGPGCPKLCDGAPWTQLPAMKRSGMDA